MEKERKKENGDMVEACSVGEKGERSTNGWLIYTNDDIMSIG